MKSMFFNFKLLSFLLAISLIASCTKDTSDLNLEEDVLGIRTDELVTEDCVFSFAELEEIPVDELDVEAMPTSRPDKCFHFNYPISIQFPDLTVVSVNNKEELISAIRTWRQDHPDIAARPHLVYPVDITLKNGTVKTINSREDMRKLIFYCTKKFRHVRLWTCVDLVFPVTIEFPDGTTTVVNDKEELKNAVTTWRENNADVAGRPKIKFPFDVTLKNGDIVTINNLNELKALLKKCIKFKRFKRFG